MFRVTVGDFASERVAVAVASSVMLLTDIEADSVLELVGSGESVALGSGEEDWDSVTVGTSVREDDATNERVTDVVVSGVIVKLPVNVCVLVEVGVSVTLTVSERVARRVSVLVTSLELECDSDCSLDKEPYVTESDCDSVGVCESESVKVSVSVSVFEGIRVLDFCFDGDAVGSLLFVTVGVSEMDNVLVDDPSSDWVIVRVWE